MADYGIRRKGLRVEFFDFSRRCKVEKMQELIIKENEANQRADKFLKKYLDKADAGFIYKMLRKKNITLNDKKISGSEKLCVGDSIKIYFSDDTLSKFVTPKFVTPIEKKISLNSNLADHDFKKKENYFDVKKHIIYEDKHIILFNKPAGILSQKAKASDTSVNELLIDYMLRETELTVDDLKTFKPSVCNRLDRNTSGLIIFGKTLVALQAFSELLKKRELHKYYLCIVRGMLKADKISGYLIKNEKNNTVEVYNEKDKVDKKSKEKINKDFKEKNKVTNKISQNSKGEYHYIETEYYPVKSNGKYTLLKVLLITGKTHQIRAHLSSIHHQLAGDMKYGKKSVNDYFMNKYKLKHQLLHSYELVFGELEGEFSYLSGKSFKADLPETFQNILEGESLKTCDVS